MMKIFKEILIWIGIGLGIVLFGAIAYLDINHTNEVYHQKLEHKQQTLTKLLKK